MRTIYTLKEFREAIKRISDALGENYSCGKIEFDFDGKVTFSSYIPKTGWTNGDTMESCISATYNKTQPKASTPVKDIDVEIDIEQEPTPQPITDNEPF